MLYLIIGVLLIYIIINRIRNYLVYKRFKANMSEFLNRNNLEPSKLNQSEFDRLLKIIADINSISINKDKKLARVLLQSKVNIVEFNQISENEN